MAVAEKDARIGERQTASSMRIKLKYPDVETFIQKYAVNISKGGIFIATKTPKAQGTPLRFEFVLADAGATAVIRGEGQVQWVREYDAAQPQKAHGMGIKFTKLDAESQAVIDRALAFRQRDQSQAGLMPEPPTSPAIPAVPPASFDSETVSGPKPVVAPPPPPPDVPVPIVTAATVAQPEKQPPPTNGLNGVSSVDLESLAQACGISEEQIARALAKPREQLTDADLAALTQPQSIAIPTLAEALAELRRLLG